MSETIHRNVGQSPKLYEYHRRPDRLKWVNEKMGESLNRARRNLEQTTKHTNHTKKRKSEISSRQGASMNAEKDSESVDR